jgi:hypothetical protein
VGRQERQGGVGDRGTQLLKTEEPGRHWFSGSLVSRYATLPDGHRTPPLFHPYSLHGENVAKAIDNEFLSKQSHFSVAELNGFLEFDSYRYLRMLCRRGFLLSVTEKSGLAEGGSFVALPRRL